MKRNKTSLITFFLISLIIVSGVLGSIKMLFGGINLGLDLQGGFEILYEVSPIEEGEELTQDMLLSTYKTISNRINSQGVTEPNITIEGNDRIRVQLAGIENADEMRAFLAQVATLTFRDTDDIILLRSDILSKGGAKLGADDMGRPAIALSIADKEKFYDVTKAISQKSDNRLVIWLDFEEGVDSLKNESNGQDCGTEGSRCLSAAYVSQGFSSDVIIQGGFTKEEAQRLVDLINSGSLPTKLNEIYHTSVGASLGEKALQSTTTAGIVGIILVLVFMMIFYRFSGFISSIGLLLYSYVVFTLFWLVGGTLTLPGIAAMVLGVGMAVDANVITFERIKEELLLGRSVSASYKEGNKRSFRTIVDANVTTLLVAVILYILGESSVKGFATMLMISIFTTFIITVFFTRFLLNLVVKSKYFEDKKFLFIGIKEKDIPDLKKGEEQKLHKFNKVDFIGRRKTFFGISSSIVILGIITMIIFRFNFGIDFTSGTNITLLKDNNSAFTQEEINNHFDELGLDIDLVTFAENNTIASIRLKELTEEEVTEIKEYFLSEYGEEPNVSVVSPVVGKELVKNAIIAMIVASIGIILYITFRFRSSFAYAAIIALLHDAFIVIALFSIFRLEITGEFVAAILAILGYSINDTIVAFDRIRENSKKMYDDDINNYEDLENLVNTSLQQTFVRSINTTVTALLPVIMLIVLGSMEILNFNIALFIGLIAGTYSSIFIAAQVWLQIEKRNIGKPKGERKKWFDVDDEVEELSIKGINT